MTHPMKADVSIAHVLPPPDSHRLLIKNMVCPQCIRVVGEDMAALGLRVHRVALGEADVSTPDGTAPDWPAIRASLREAGFELLEDPRDQLVDRIKTLLVALIHYPRPARACSTTRIIWSSTWARTTIIFPTCSPLPKASRLRNSSSARRWSAPRS